MSLGAWLGELTRGQLLHLRKWPGMVIVTVGIADIWNIVLQLNFTVLQEKTIEEFLIVRSMNVSDSHGKDGNMFSSTK